MLHVVSWLWGDKYGKHFIERLARSVARNLDQPHVFHAVTERNRKFDLPASAVRHDIPDISLVWIDGCFSRLRMFDPSWQQSVGIKAGDTIVSMDVDAVVTGKLDPLFDRPCDLRIIQGINSTNPCPYNGSLWQFPAATRPDVWTDFSIDEYKRLGVPFHAFPDDQGWLCHKFPDALAWGQGDGVYGFHKVGWPPGEALPGNARFVCFPGWRNPERYLHLDWVRENWR